MGKYETLYKKRKNEPSDVFISLMLRDIANELAEANRLKRIELSKTFLKVRLDCKDEDMSKTVCTPEELKDQA